MIAPAVLPVFAILVAAPTGPEEGCPSAHQVTEAMHSRFPSSLIPAEPASSSPRLDVLRASLDVAGDGTVVRFSLLDAHGDTQLRRTLPAPGRGQPITDCLALADTLAAIVERYLGFIAYDSSEAETPVAPPPAQGSAAVVRVAPAAPVAAPPPVRPRKVLLMLGAGWRMASEGSGQPEGMIGAQMDLTRSVPRVAASLTLGASPSISDAVTNSAGATRQATLTRFPVRLGALLELPSGPGFVEPAVQMGVDLLAISIARAFGSTSPSVDRLGAGVEVEAAVGYRLPVTRTLYLRPKGTIGVSLLRRDIMADGTHLFSKPVAHASFGIDTGVVFQ